jgi:hypothetical protein
MSTEPDPFGPLEVHKKAQLAREMKQEEQEEAFAKVISWHKEIGQTFIQADEEPRPVEYMVDGLMSFDGITLYTAKSKLGKSSLTSDLAIAGASGTGSIKTPDGRWLFDFKGKAVKTYYLDTENSRSLVIRRFESLANEKGASRKDLLASGQLVLNCLEVKNHPPFLDPKAETLEDNVRRAREWGELLGRAGYRFIILDVASQCYPEDDHGRDENDRAFVANFFKIVCAIRSGANACVLLVHHHKKGPSDQGNEMASGSGQWLRTPTTMISVSKLPESKNPEGDLFEMLIEGREGTGFGRKFLKARGTADGVCRAFDQVEEPVKEKKPPGRQSGDQSKTANEILDCVLFKDQGLADRQIKRKEWLELVQRVSPGKDEWPKSADTLWAYLTKVLVSAGRVSAVSPAQGIYQVLR